MAMMLDMVLCSCIVKVGERYGRVIWYMGLNRCTGSDLVRVSLLFDSLVFVVTGSVFVSLLDQQRRGEGQEGQNKGLAGSEKASPVRRKQACGTCRFFHVALSGVFLCGEHPSTFREQSTVTRTAFAFLGHLQAAPAAKGVAICHGIVVWIVRAWW